MPTLLKINGYRFFFFSLEGNEPPHVHIEHGDKLAKYWIKPVDFVYSIGFKKHELTKIKILVIEYRLIFLERWYEYFGS